MALWRAYSDYFPSQTILIIADNSERAAFWRQLIGESGYDVIFGEVTRAGQTAHNLKPHLVLVEVDLPHIARLRLYRSLKAASRAVLMTIVPLHPLEIIESYGAGVDECLVQPTNPALVLVKVAAWMIRQQIPIVDRFLPPALL